MPGKGHIPELTERIVRSMKANTNRTAGGLGSNASPGLTRDRIAASARTSSGIAPSARSSKVDDWDITGTGTSSFTTTYAPIRDSWNLMLNGLRVHRDEFTVTGRSLSIASAADLFKGVASQGSPWNLELQYDYLKGAPIEPVDTGLYVEEVMADGPWLFWRGKDASVQEVPDFSGNARDGTWNSDLYPTVNLPGIVPTVDDGLAVDGFGVSAAASAHIYYTGSHTTLQSTSLSVECWFTPESIPQPGEHATGGLIDLGAANGPIVYIGGFGGASDRLVFYMLGVDLVVNSVMAADTLYHVVATYNASTGAMKLYLNDSLIGSSSTTTGGLPSAPTVAAGKQFNNLRNFDGPLQEVAVYTSELSAARVAAHYSAGVGA